MAGLYATQSAQRYGMALDVIADRVRIRPDVVELLGVLQPVLACDFGIAAKHELSDIVALVAAALILGSIGDALLELSPDYFVFGLVAFLCGHVVYIVAFLRTGARRPPPVLIQLGLILYAAGFAWWLWPNLGQLQIPVLVYMATLTTMASCSLRIGPVVATGAALFLLSDSLLAANRFRRTGARRRIRRLVELLRGSGTNRCRVPEAPRVIAVLLPIGCHAWYDPVSGELSTSFQRHCRVAANARAFVFAFVTSCA